MKLVAENRGLIRTKRKGCLTLAHSSDALTVAVYDLGVALGQIGNIDEAGEIATQLAERYKCKG